MPKTMDRLMYLVSPVNDQCDWDEDGSVSLDLFVWAKTPSEAVKLWGEHYGYGEDGMIPGQLGIITPVRVFEIPIMRDDASSTLVPWRDVHEHNATDTYWVTPAK